MKYLCTTLENLSADIVGEVMGLVPEIYSNYYYTLGPDKCKSLSYQRNYLEKSYETEKNNLNVNIDDEIWLNFKEGDKILKSDLKLKLQSVYDSMNYSKKAKASDIDFWFEVKSILINSGGKRIHGFELIRKKK